ncbi:MAG: immunoglobulin domain-containing protein [Ferruginibacter sp.]|nr:immunoglobulin domain-containing protein [Ferruginibacter sp.]
MTFIPNSTSAQGTMGRWEVCGLSGTPATVSPTGVSSGVTFSVLSRGPGITAQSATGAFNSSGWSTSSTLSISNNDYYEFTITPEPGRSISISAIRFRDQMSNTSFDVSLRYSDNSYDSSLGGWTASTSATNRSVNLSSVSSLQNRTTPVTFRLYGTDASGSSSTYRLICQGTGAGQYRGVDVDGTVTHNLYVAEFVSMSYGSSPWCQGETRDVSVTVKNVGSATWNSAEPVNIGLKWNEDVDYGASPSFIPRQPAGSVATGQTVTYTFPNVPASTLTGNNNLRFDVVRELVCWFGNNSGGCGPGNSVFVSPTINILAQPTAVTVSGGGTFCNSRTLTASGGTGGTMYFQGTDPNGISTGIPATSRVVTESGTYYFRSRSAAGCWSVAGSATVTINKDVAITTQPQNQTICEGEALNLSVTATGTPAPTYQWKKNNIDILGETNATLNIPSALNSDGGSYTVAVTNTCNSITSSGATVLVNIAPVVTVDPTNETVCEGAPVTFTVTATGTNLTYQWRKGGVDINGATGTSYNIASTILANAGNYDVVVSNIGCTPATSASAVLTVNARPTAVITSSSETICSATATTVSGNVTATGAWALQLSDGQTTSGSGNGSFSFTVSPVNTTTYTLVSLSDVNCSSQGGDLTGSVTITTNPLPAGVSVTPPTATICNGGAQTLNANGSTSETSSTLVNNNFSTGVSASGSTTGNRSQIFERENSGSNINSTGTFTSPNGSGMLVALSAASATGFIATANSTANTSAEMQVSTVGYNSLNLTFNHTYAQANNGGSGIVAVSTDGVNWTNVQSYSANQGGQTNFVGASIALSNAYLNQPALRIRFTYTATASSSGFLTTAHAYWWAIDDVSINGTLLPLYSWTANTGPSENGLPSGAGTPSADNLEIEVTPSATTKYTLTATNPVTGCISTATSVVTVNARPTAVLSGGAVYCNGENTTTALTLNVTGSGTISGTLSDNTPFSGTAPVITVNVAPSITTAYTIATLNDENCTAIAADMSGSATVTVNDRPTAVLSGGATYCENENSTTTLTLTVTGSGTISGTLSDNTTFSGTAPTITVNVAPFESTVYTIETLQDANCNALEADLSGSATIIVNPLIPVSVVIESSDLDNEICTGTSVTFTATPGNGGNASYQWLLNGNPVGTNQNTFTTDALVDGDQVSVVLTSDVTPCATGNPATSNVITTTVHALQPVSVSIASSDLDNTICDGESVTFTATPVNGGSTPSYQWLLNGNPVGSDQDTYTSTTLADGDVVSVVLTSNITPCATGNPATSNTIATTVDALQPVSITIASDVSAACSGVLISFTATPVNEGDNPAYQWYVNNIAVVDSTGTTFSSAALADGDEVTCVLTSNITPCAAGNPATSNVITVTIGEIPPTPGAITGPLDVCPHVNTGIPVTYSIDPVVGATSYTWTVPVGATIVSGQGTTSIEVLIDDNFALTNSKFRVASNNDFPCSSPNAVLEVLKNVPGIPLAISGPTNVCEYVGQPTTATYSIAPVANAVSYTWTVANSNMVIVSGQGSTSIEVSYLNGFVRGNVRVTANSNCGARAPRSLNVALQTVSAPEAINGPVNVCSIMENTLIATYTVTPVANATSYIWTVPTGATIESGQGTNSIMVSFGSGFVSGQIKVKSVSNCNTSGDRSLTVSAYNIYTPGLITGPTNVCGYMVSVNNPAGTPVAYSIKKVTNATSYVWSAPAGATIVAHPAGAGENDTIVEVVFNSNFTGGAITVRSSGFCGMSAIRSLNISFLKPSAPGIITATETGTCPDRTYTYSLASIPSGALSILWTVPSGATIVSGQGTGSISVSYPSGAVRGAVTATSVSHCANSATRSLNVNLADCNQPRIVKSDAVPVKTFKAELNVQLAPNPMVHTSRLTITGSSKNMADVRIMDQLGRERFRTRAAVNSTITVGEKLEAGAYFLEVSLDGQREVKKFIKL